LGALERGRGRLRDPNRERILERLLEKHTWLEKISGRQVLVQLGGGDGKPKLRKQIERGSSREVVYYTHEKKTRQENRKADYSWNSGENTLDEKRGNPAAERPEGGGEEWGARTRLNKKDGEKEKETLNKGKEKHAESGDGRGRCMEKISPRQGKA